MSEMVDRVAQAIADELARQEGNEESFILHDGKLSYLDQEEVDMLAVARAAIEAMREPTKQMIDAGIDAADTVEDYTQDTDGSYRVDSPSDMPFPIYRAMIDAALNP